MTDPTKTDTNRSVQISGGRQGIVSFGDNAHIQVNALNLGAVAGDDPETRKTLETLVTRLNGLLETVPPDQKDHAEAVATYTDQLIDQAGAEAPNKPMLQITAKGMKEAAQALAGVVPSAVTVVKEIADTVMSMVS